MASREEVLGIIERLRQDPSLADELRVVLLTEELLGLPQRFSAFVSEVRTFVEAADRRLGNLESAVAVLRQDVGTLKEDVGTLKEDVGALKKDVKVLKEDVGTLKEDVTVLKEDVGALKKDVKVLKDDVGMLKGGHFESRWLRHACGYMIRYGFLAARPVEQAVLLAAAREAMSTGLLGSDEVEELLDADAVMLAERSSDGLVVYLVCEVASRLHADDISRAARRAEIAARLDGTASVAVAAGASIDEAAASLADSEGVVAVLPASWRRAA